MSHKRIVVLLGLLLVSGSLVGFTPLQTSGGFEWQWWHGLVLITCLLLPLLIFVLSLAFRDAPDPALLRAQAREEEAALAAARAAVRSAPAAAAQAAEAVPPAGPDDLQKIEGVGPKIASLLVEGGVRTFAELAAADTGRLQAILDAAGSRFQMADPASWPAQARLAADGEWDALQKMQDTLRGGRSDDA